MISVEAAEHGFVARVAVALVTRVLVRLESGIARFVCVRAKGIEFNRADNRARRIGNTLAFGHRVFVHPVDAALLDGEHTAALIDIASGPSATAVDFRNDLSPENRRTQIPSR